mgnify:CR=1 FL=1
MRNLVVALCLTLASLAVAPAWAETDPTFRIEFRDGDVSPREINVPANTRIRLELVNVGKTPAEFESHELKKEKVLAPKTTSVLVIRTLAPGRYQFFDDFHPGQSSAVLIAK